MLQLKTLREKKSLPLEKAISLVERNKFVLLVCYKYPQQIHKIVLKKIISLYWVACFIYLKMCSAGVYYQSGKLMLIYSYQYQ